MFGRSLSWRSRRVPPTSIALRRSAPCLRSSRLCTLPRTEVVQFDVYVEPGGMLTGTGMQHVHPRADEEFTVISGKLAVVVDGAPRMLEPGQSLNVMRGT